VPAADVSDAGTRAQFVLDPVQRGQPGGRQVGQVARPEEPLAPFEHLGVVLVPADTGAAAYGRRDPRFGAQRAEGELERPGYEDRTVRVGERERLLLGERVGAAVRVVLHITAGCLPPQPLVDVARIGAGVRSQLRRCARRGGQRPVETQPLADHHVAGGHRRAQVTDEPAQELHQPVVVHCHDLSPS
jgi:hypothetical protein